MNTKPADDPVDYDTSLGRAIEFHSDKGYSESTLEKYEEFNKKRNYQWTTNPTEWDNWKPIK